jgi:hypothetical protein
MFPLRLMFEEYHRAAKESPGVGAAVLRAFDDALTIIRSAETAR